MEVETMLAPAAGAEGMKATDSINSSVSNGDTAAEGVGAGEGEVEAGEEGGSSGVEQPYQGKVSAESFYLCRLENVTEFVKMLHSVRMTFCTHGNIEL